MRNRGWGPPVDQGLEFWSSDNVYYSGVSPCALSRMIGRFTGLFRMRQFTGTRDAPYDSEHRVRNGGETKEQESAVLQHDAMIPLESRGMTLAW